MYWGPEEHLVPVRVWVAAALRPRRQQAHQLVTEDRDGPDDGACLLESLSHMAPSAVPPRLEVTSGPIPTSLDQPRQQDGVPVEHQTESGRRQLVWGQPVLSVRTVEKRESLVQRPAVAYSPQRTSSRLS